MTGRNKGIEVNNIEKLKAMAAAVTADNVGDLEVATDLLILAVSIEMVPQNAEAVLRQLRLRERLMQERGEPLTAADGVEIEFMDKAAKFLGYAAKLADRHPIPAD
jgi:hypothetical protein